MNENFRINGQPVRDMTDDELNHYTKDCETRLKNCKALISKVLGDTEQIGGMLAILSYESDRRSRSIVVVPDMKSIGSPT